MGTNVMSSKVFHPGKLVLFVILSFIDLYLTWRLVSLSGGCVYESNPIANWWLKSLGWLGLGIFKFSTMSMVATLTVIISRYRPRIGGLVLTFGCTTLSAVVLYSCLLSWELGVTPRGLMPTQFSTMMRIR
jgi:hypothetical protein